MMYQGLLYPIDDEVRRLGDGWKRGQNRYLSFHLFVGTDSLGVNEQG